MKKTGPCGYQMAPVYVVAYEVDYADAPAVTYEATYGVAYVIAQWDAFAIM